MDLFSTGEITLKYGGWSYTGIAIKQEVDCNVAMYEISGTMLVTRGLEDSRMAVDLGGINNPGTITINGEEVPCQVTGITFNYNRTEITTLGDSQRVYAPIPIRECEIYFVMSGYISDLTDGQEVSKKIKKVIEISRFDLMDLD